ncbi:T9SS type A sorting domain-containing protein [Bacteroidota bacterium]
MKNLLLIFLGLIIVSSNASSQNNKTENEPHAIYRKNSNINLQSQTDYYYPLFVNYNVSNNSFPQNEPSVRISRQNPNIVVAAWRDFRLGVDPAVRRIGYSYSADGGLNWSTSQLLPDPLPEHTSQSDPVLTTDSYGHFYLSSTSRQPVSGYNRDMLIYKSTDNGQTFFLHSKAVPGSGGAGEDKEWIFCDPVLTNPTYDNIFITWTSFGPSTGIKFRKSSDAGLNWSSTVNVSDASYGAQGSNVASGTNGDILVVWRRSGVKFDKSTNGGVSFDSDYSLSTVTSTNNGSFPFICVDYSNHSSRGNIYVVWADDRQSNTDDIYFQRSTNYGQTWLSTPVQVNDVATGEQYWPAIQCDTNGNICVIYYDERIAPGVMNSYFAYSTDAGDTWINQRLSDTSFFGNTPNSDVRYGDYIGIDVFANRVVPVWTDDRAGGYNQEIYSTSIILSSISLNSQTVPNGFSLKQNYPNPFNPSTKIVFDIPKNSNATLKIYNTLGKEIENLDFGNIQAGSYTYEWIPENLSSGVYFYSLKTKDFSDTKKMLYIK